MPHKQNIKTLAGITGSQTAVKVENQKKKETVGLQEWKKYKISFWKRLQDSFVNRLLEITFA